MTETQKSNALNVINIVFVTASLATILNTAITIHQWKNRYEAGLNAVINSHQRDPAVSSSDMTLTEEQPFQVTEMSSEKEMPEDAQRTFAKAYFAFGNE